MIKNNSDVFKPDDPLFTEDAQTILTKRYLKKDQSGQPSETVEEMIWRVASAIAAPSEKWPMERAFRSSRYSLNDFDLATEFARLMSQGVFLPNSPTLMNAGLPGGQLAACFVLPVEDNMSSIFGTLEDAAMVHKSGGGTGFSFSRLRPRGSQVGSTSGVASGPVSFMRIYDTATEQVKQGGRRRGANMGILRVDHPDIFEFVRCKSEEGHFENFNLSVGITDEFMSALESGDAFELKDPRTGEAVEKVAAHTIWDMIIENAWLRGDPGVVFLDTINRDHCVDKEIEATNPCGESPLLPYEACNLGSINLSKFVRDNASVDWEWLTDVVRLSVEFLDNVIEVSEYPVSEIKDRVKETRKIGLGVMGWADVLFNLGIPYDTAEAVVLGRKFMSHINREAWRMSKDLAKTRGSFPADVKPHFLDPESSEPIKPRNATVTSIAPTGTLSMLAGCSSGIEPLFSLSMTKTVLDGTQFYQVNPVFLDRLEKYLEQDDWLPALEDILDALGRGEKLSSMGLPEEFCRPFVTAQEIAPKDHLHMQAAFQQYVDLAVSKTINLPNSATRKDIGDIYQLAWQEGCKGVTVFRDGCRSMQVLTRGTGQAGSAEHDGPEPRSAGSPRKRPESLPGFTHKVKTGMGELYLTVNELDGQPFEVFATIGKSGRSVMAEAESIGRLVSLALRSGISVSEVVKQLRGIGGDMPVFHKKRLLLSTADAVSWILEHNYLAVTDPPAFVQPDMLCPECDAFVVREEGCLVCKSCGWTKCG